MTMSILFSILSCFVFDWRLNTSGGLSLYLSGQLAGFPHAECVHERRLGPCIDTSFLIISFLIACLVACLHEYMKSYSNTVLSIYACDVSTTLALLLVTPTSPPSSSPTPPSPSPSPTPPSTP